MGLSSILSLSALQDHFDFGTPTPALDLKLNVNLNIKNDLDFYFVEADSLSMINLKHELLDQDLVTNNIIHGKNGADENGWLYFESDVSEYEDDVSFRLRFESNTFTQLEGLYVDNFAVYSLPPIPNDVGTRELDSPNTAKPGRTVTFTSEIYNFGTNDQDDFDVRGTVTRDDGTEVYNETQTIDSLESKTNSTLEWTWEGGPEGTYTIRVETLLTGDERAGNNPKDIPKIAATPAAKITPAISITYHSGYVINKKVS